MAIVVVGVDQLFWRPLVAWSDKFRLEQSASAHAPRSWVYDILRDSRLPYVGATLLRPAAEPIGKLLRLVTSVRRGRIVPDRVSLVEHAYDATLLVAVATLVIITLRFVLMTVGITELGHALFLGLCTLGRVLFLVAFASVVWTPIGIAIGFNPRLARIAQPIALFLASFPANFVFPFATVVLIRFGLPINLGSMLLMALGSQWYILFNSIAGAQSIPTDLREMAADFRLRGWPRWKRLIGPGIFSAWVTGGITASGGAWNASIVSEVVTWGSTTLVATGLGAYIAQATGKGDWPRIALGVGAMSFYVVLLNRLVWRRLYALAQRKYRL